jgi:hypothetical protein
MPSRAKMMVWSESIVEAVWKMAVNPVNPWRREE